MGFANFLRRALLASFATCAGCSGAFAASNEVLRIAYMDPLSGPFAASAEEGLRHLKFMAQTINSAGGVDGKTIEIVPMDNQGSPENSVVLLKKAIDDGYQYVIQGLSSSVAYALSDAVAKNNKRNPGHKIVYLDYSNADPGLTNDKCNYYYFRFDANLVMKMRALAVYFAGKKDIKNIYLINPDYTMGRSVESAAMSLLPAARPGVSVVGHDLIPLGKVNDFTPYIAKIRASGADAVVTGEWGKDLILMLKAAAENKLPATFYTYYGNTSGLPTALGSAAEGMMLVNEWHSNVGSAEIDKMAAAFKASTGKEFVQWRIALTMNMLADAMNQAHSTDPAVVAAKLEGLRYQTPMGEAVMRADDHQVLEPLFISELSKGNKYDLEGTGLGFRTMQKVAAADTAVPTTCKMTRPGR